MKHLSHRALFDSGSAIAATNVNSANETVAMQTTDTVNASTGTNAG